MQRAVELLYRAAILNGKQKPAGAEYAAHLEGARRCQDALEQALADVSPENLPVLEALLEHMDNIAEADSRMCFEQGFHLGSELAQEALGG